MILSSSLSGESVAGKSTLSGGSVAGRFSLLGSVSDKMLTFHKSSGKKIATRHDFR